MAKPGKVKVGDVFFVHGDGSMQPMAEVAFDGPFELTYTNEPDPGQASQIAWFDEAQTFEAPKVTGYEYTPYVADVVPKPSLLFSKALSTAVVLPEPSLPDFGESPFYSGFPLVAAKNPAAAVAVVQETPGAFPLPDLSGLVKKPTPDQRKLLDGVELVTAADEEGPAPLLVTDMLKKHDDWITADWKPMLPDTFFSWPDQLKKLQDAMKPMVISFKANIGQMADALQGSIQAMADAYGAMPVSTFSDPDLDGDEYESNVGRAEKLRRLIPGVEDEVELPCEHNDRKTVWFAIQHLNDHHNPNTPQPPFGAPRPAEYDWSRERIADWLETLDADLRIQDPPPVPATSLVKNETPSPFVIPDEAGVHILTMHGAAIPGTPLRIGEEVMDKVTGITGVIRAAVMGYNMDYDKDMVKSLRVVYPNHAMMEQTLADVVHPPCCPHASTINGHCTDCMDTGHCHPSDTPQHYGLDFLPPELDAVESLDPSKPVWQPMQPHLHDGWSVGDTASIPGYGTATVVTYVVAHAVFLVRLHSNGKHMQVLPDLMTKVPNQTLPPQKHMLGLEKAQLPGIGDVVRLAAGPSSLEGKIIACQIVGGVVDPGGVTYTVQWGPGGPESKHSPGELVVVEAYKPPTDEIVAWGSKKITAIHPNVY